ncbi:NEDD4 family-interacting protein 2 isoform X2 [Dendrobates tinctorius]|uniref:NEDD4 family-interacting protein 2 isoform X2 n=1 Tax=Dendrobates tinctorius TaxID=92724 RepID=UPI003CC9CD0A
MDHLQAANRYQVLENEEDASESPTVEQPSTSSQASQACQTTAAAAVDASPPPYSSVVVDSCVDTEAQNEFYPVPPPYSVATTLPTYDEAEKAKAAAMAAVAAEATQREEEYPPRDDFSDADQLRVGNDGIFMLAFFMAFIFNWIGFCLSFCITNTIAGRYGAICGFGLSLIKWILIVRVYCYSLEGSSIISKYGTCRKVWRRLIEQDFFSCTKGKSKQTFLSLSNVNQEGVEEARLIDWKTTKQENKSLGFQQLPLFDRIVEYLL